MGYAVAMALCYGCRQPFTFNPLRVPYTRVNGTRAAICAACMALVNEERVRHGFEPWPIAPDAYGPVDEAELDTAE